MCGWGCVRALPPGGFETPSPPMLLLQPSCIAMPCHASPRPLARDSTCGKYPCCVIVLRQKLDMTHRVFVWNRTQKIPLRDNLRGKTAIDCLMSALTSPPPHRLTPSAPPWRIPSRTPVHRAPAPPLPSKSHPSCFNLHSVVCHFPQRPKVVPSEQFPQPFPARFRERRPFAVIVPKWGNAD